MKLAQIYRSTLTATALVFAGQNALAMDPCLEGWWEADYFVLADQFMEQMDATSMQITGNAYMRFSGAQRGEYFTYDLGLDVEMPEVPPMKVIINGGGDFVMDASDGVFRATMGHFNYNAVLHSPVLGEMEFPFNDTNSPFGGGIGGYECSDEALELIQGEDSVRQNSFVKRWVRIADDPR